jgi:hypothetical protein
MGSTDKIVGGLLIIGGMVCTFFLFKMMLKKQV